MRGMRSAPQSLRHACTKIAVARYYDPTTAQFLSRDPLEAETGAPYSYAGGEPLNASDPSGLDWCIGSVCLGFHPGDAIKPIVNIGRGASFGLSDKIANLFSPGASCTVTQNSVDQLIGAAATAVAGEGILGGLLRVAPWLAPTTADIAALVPEGETLASWGAQIWGRGVAGAEALTGARTAAELEQLGLTADKAATLRDFYQAAADAGKGAETATARVSLLNNIIETLGG
jgi:hypothetical protein